MQDTEYKKTNMRLLAIATILCIIAIGFALFGMQTTVKVHATSIENEVYYKIMGEGNNLTMKLGSKTAVPDGEIYEGTQNGRIVNSEIEKDNVKKVEIVDMICPLITQYYFYDFHNLEEIAGLQKLDTSNVTDMSAMFFNCKKLQKVNLSYFDTAKVTDMSSMFFDCEKLQELDLSSFNTSEVTDMSCMFSNCEKLQELDLSSFNTSEVTDMSFMFFDCDELQELDLSSFNTSEVLDMGYMFNCVYNLETIYASDEFVTDEVDDNQTVFYNCFKLVGGAGTKYDWQSSCNRDYAHIDGKDSKPGLFTKWTFQNISWIGDDEKGYEEAVASYTLYDSNVIGNSDMYIYDTEEETQPTCDEPGLVVYKAFLAKQHALDHVERRFTKEVVLPPEGHDYGDWERLNDKQHQRVCENDESHIEKKNHAWNAGELTKKPTVSQTGEKKYKCKVCGATKKESVPKLKKKSSAEKEIASMKKDADLKGSVFRELQLTSRKQSRSSVKIQWKKIKGAVKYVVFGGKCGSKNKIKKLISVKGTSKSFKRLLGKKLKNGTYYKFIVIALDKDNTAVSISKMVHVATKGGKVGNHKKVIIRAKTGTKTKTIRTAKLKRGNSLRLKPKLKPANKKSKVRNHVSIRYESSNTKVASVSKKGVITAKGKGKCIIYAYAQNGVSSKIKLSVK